MLAEADTRKLDEFYLLLVLKKLTEREELLEFLQTLKVKGSLIVERQHLENRTPVGMPLVTRALLVASAATAQKPQ